MDFVMFEAVTFIVWLLLIFGFLDKVFFLISSIIGFFFAAWAMNDANGFVINQVYNSTTATWVLYTISVYPYILLMAMPTIVSTLIFITLVTRNTEEAILF
jgi:hypothetical protein